MSHLHTGLTPFRTLSSRSRPRNPSAAARRRRRFAPAALEALESRVLLSAIVMNPSPVSIPLATHAGGGSGDAIVRADFNGDGNLDFAVAESTFNQACDRIEVLFGNGHGGYAHAATYNSTGGYSGYFSDLAVGDFNGDAHPDLAVITSGSSVAIFFNLGTGAFAAPVAYATATYPARIAVADFNADGIDDLAVTCTNLTGLSCLLSQTTGGFSRFDLRTSALPTDIVAADFTGDGRPDLALALKADVIVLANNGQGGFDNIGQYTATYPISIAAADLSGDGKPDLALLLASGGTTSVTTLINQGHGTFGPAFTCALGATTTSFRKLALADFNGDGFPDVAVTNGTNALFLTNQGNGSFGDLISYPLANSPIDFTGTDFNGDGKADLVMKSGWDGQLLALENPDTIALAPTLNYPLFQGPLAIASADLNADHRPDLVLRYASYPLSVLLNTGPNSFATPVAYPLPFAINDLTLADLNADGFPDIALADASGVSVLLNLGNGAFASPVRYPDAHKPSAIVAADFDNNGSLDLATADYSDNTIRVLLNQGVGTFTAATASSTLSSNLIQLVAADFDVDGRTDLAVTSNLGVTLLQNVGAGGFTNHSTLSANNPTSIVAGDFNGDSLMDIAIGATSSANLTLLFNQRNWSFIGTDRSTDSYPAALLAVDLNHDGICDLATACPQNQTVRILQGSTSTNFPASTYSCDFPVTAIASADVNLDDTPDLIVPLFAALKFLPNVSGHPTQAIAEHLFYNNSLFDLNGSLTGPADDAALDPSKAPLLPGQTASAANYSSYASGINGIMIDLTGAPRTLAASDFSFKVGNDNNPDAWTDAPAPLAITQRLGDATGAWTRIEITWPDNAIQNTWLQVTLKGGTGSTSGLPADLVFYFGSAPGDTANDSASARVDMLDELTIRANYTTNAAITNPYDLNRDGTVDAADELFARTHATCFLNELSLITPPALPAAFAPSTPDTHTTAATAPALEVTPLTAAAPPSIENQQSTIDNTTPTATPVTDSSSLTTASPVTLSPLHLVPLSRPPLTVPITHNHVPLTKSRLTTHFTSASRRPVFTSIDLNDLAV
jgi:hypothetical protein